MFSSVLVVCVGNICRSPLGERALRQGLPGMTVTSAGLGAVVGSAADETAARVAAEAGVDLGGHVARQLTAEIGGGHDLILVMEPGHLAEVRRRHPHLAGRTMLFDHWSGARGIADPYRMPEAFHREARDQILTATKAWVNRLGKKAG